MKHLNCLYSLFPAFSAEMMAAGHRNRLLNRRNRVGANFTLQVKFKYEMNKTSSPAVATANQRRYMTVKCNTRYAVTSMIVKSKVIEQTNAKP